MIPYGVTFTVFFQYGLPAIRMAAISKYLGPSFSVAKNCKHVKFWLIKLTWRGVVLIAQSTIDYANCNARSPKYKIYLFQ